MRLLSLDLAFSTSNFTLLENEKILKVYGESESKKDLEIFPKIFETLEVDIHSVDVFTVNVGVGYSTGLRIGVTMAKTYAQISKKPLVVYTSYEALLENFPLNGLFLVVFKISRYFVGGIWRKEGKTLSGVEYPFLLTPADLEKKLKGCGGIVLPEGVLGDFSKTFDVKGIPTYGVSCELLSLGGGKVALRKADRGDFADILKVEPLYFRPPV